MKSFLSKYDLVFLSSNGQATTVSFIISIFLMLLTAVSAMGQCADPDVSIWENTWHTCAEAASPNPERGEGHWIQYDFGQSYTLTTTQVWNTNAPERLSEGFREVIVDYSLNGEEWLTLDTVLFEQGTGAPTYGGFPAFDFAGDSARYVLLTALSNFGHPSCFGLAEVKFNLSLGLEPFEVEEVECYNPEFATAFVMNSAEVYILWEYISLAETYTFRYREEGGTWIDVTVEEDEPEMFLWGLRPETTYEYQIAAFCEEVYLDYGRSFYFTTTEALEACTAPIVSDWFFVEEDEYLIVACNEVPEAINYTLRYRVASSNDEWQELPSEENFWLIEDFSGEDIYEYQISVQCPDGQSEFSVLFIINTEDLVSTKEVTPGAEFKLFPNPTQGMVNLSLTTSSAGQVQVVVRNLMGQVVLKEVYELANGPQGFVLPTQKLRAGAYTVSVYEERNDRIGVRKLIIAK